PVMPHVLGVADKLKLLGHLRLGDERALALDAMQPSLDDQFRQSLADRGARRAVLFRERAFGGERTARSERRDQLDQVVLQAVVLGAAGFHPEFRGPLSRHTLTSR